MAVEMFASALVALVVEKAADPVLQQFGVMWGSDNLEKLRGALLAIRSKLGDAEERQVMDPAVRDWLAALKGAAYDAEDILDEFNTEVLRRRAEIQNDMINKVRDFFSSRNPVLFRYAMGKKLKDIVERIDDLEAKSHRFNFTVSTQPQTQDRPQTHSCVDETEVIGRDNDKDRAVDLLLAQVENKNVTVLPIVGMGGLGKTTFAKLVYNDSRVQNHFQLLMWVCVSDRFDMTKLVKEIVAAGTGSACDLPTMDLLQRRLREVVSNKRYLLVLDDVWNEDQDNWEELRTLINCGKEGSAIIATTRSARVSSIMGTLPAFPLPYLSPDDSWTLFEKRAFAIGAEQRPELVRIGKEIVGKCQGLPIAVKALGSLMHGKTEDKEWLAVMDSEIWNIQLEEDRIFAALRLSYNHLRPHLKQCFAFCAIFPKDHQMEKDVLIQLWMAHGFIPSEGNVELEVKGHQIFNELVWRSFFQDIQQINKGDYCGFTKYGYRGRIICKMHDLMHDLAQSVMKNESIVMLEPSHLDRLSENVRHLSTYCTASSDVRRVLNEVPTSVRTLLVPKSYGMMYVTMNPINDLSKPSSLRALELHAKDSMKLLKSIARLTHLRYLDLSRTHIETLPENISMLCNLQTLKLSECELLRMLPEDIRHMSGLRHVYLDGCDNLKHMPPGIGQLSCLQTLTKYIVGSDAGSTITELKCLNLCGALGLYNLKSLSNVADAREANMSSKQNLRSLAYCWGVSEWKPYNFKQDDELQAENSEEVLEALKPHSGLEMLVLRSYHGVRFPTWMMVEPQLQNLVEIHLGGCIHCEKLPPLWQLPSLEVLCLWRLDAIKHICSSTVDGAGSTGPFQAFPSLKVLFLCKMQNLEAWWEGEGRTEWEPLFFPQLVDLFISDCPKLASLPRLPETLDRFKIHRSDRVPLRQISSLTTLTVLWIGPGDPGTRGRTLSPLLHQEVISFKQLKSLEQLIMDGNNEFTLLLEDEDEALALGASLRQFDIRNCNWMFSSQLTPAPFGFWKHLTSLRRLGIFDCDSLVYWPERELRALSSLTSLYIKQCKNLTGKSQSLLSTGEGSTPSLENLYLLDCDGPIEFPKCPASLKSLLINHCQNLESLAGRLEHLTALEYLKISECSNLTSLEDLRIPRCSNLTSLPEGMQGLTALKNLTIRECPVLTWLPEGLRQRLPSIEEVEIKGCPEIERQCKRKRSSEEGSSGTPYRWLRPRR